MPVALVIQNAVRVQHIVIYVPSGSTILFFIIPQIARFSGEGGGEVIEYKMRVLIFYTTFAWNIPRSKKNQVRYDQKCILVFN